MNRKFITFARWPLLALFVLVGLAFNARGQGAAPSRRATSSSSPAQAGSGDPLVQKPKAYWDNYQSQIIRQVFEGTFGSSVDGAAEFRILFNSYVESFSEKCRAYLPARHDTLTLSQGTEKRDRYGNVVSQPNSHSATIEVEPRFTPYYRRYASSLGSTSAENLGALVGIMAGKTSTNALFAPGLDADRFFQTESCQGTAMRQLGENLLRAASGESSLQRAGVKDLSRAIAEDRRSREEMQAREAATGTTRRNFSRTGKNSRL